MLRLSIPLFAGALLATTAISPASAAFIDFEDAPSRGLADNDLVTNQYQGDYGIVFDGAFLEDTATTSPNGFLNDDLGTYDEGDVPGLGAYFLRTGGGDVIDRGDDDAFMTINFDSATTSISAQIWDIDGNTSQGTEQWNVVAYNGATMVGNVLSPLGSTLDGTPPDSWDGLPWDFTLSGIGAFDRVEFIFVGSKQAGIGLAFDNFQTGTPVPEPGSFALLGSGLIGLFAASRRRKSKTEA